MLISINAYVGVDRLATTVGMDMKTLVYRRLPSQSLLPSKQQQLPALSVKSLVYSRVERSASSQLEGTSFESNFRSVPCKCYKVFWFHCHTMTLSKIFTRDVPIMLLPVSDDLNQSIVV